MQAIDAKIAKLEARMDSLEKLKLYAEQFQVDTLTNADIEQTVLLMNQEKTRPAK